MENDNNSKNLAKLAKLQKQLKTDQEKLKTYIKKLAPPKKKAKREYAHFPARDDDGRLIRHPGRKRKFAEIDQNKEKGNLTLNDESSVQQDGLMSMINANVSKSIDELKTKINQLRISTKSNDKTIWEKRKQRETENWANARHCLFEAVIKTKFADPLTVHVCCKCQNPTDCLIRCQQCAATLCNTCDEDVHTVNALHDRQVKIMNHWADVAPLQGVDIDDKGEVNVSIAERYPPVFNRCDCGSTHFDFAKRCKVAVITEKGRYDVLLPNVECLDCEKDISPKIEDLISRGFWPGSPRIHDGMYLFSEDLLRLFDYLKLEKAGMSVKAFTSALQFLSASHGRQSVISQKIFHEAFREWRKCKYEVEQLEKKDAMSCPACRNDLHACHIDGNRKLYRFKNMAISTEENYFKNVFIVDDKLVEEITGKIQATRIQTSSKKGKCKIKSCRCYNKELKNLPEHLQKCHMITEARHNLLPECEEKVEEEQASSSSWMKYRTPERCFVEGCRKYGTLFKDLRKHLRVVHNVNSPAYKALKQRGSGSIARIMALINVEEDIKSSWKNTAGYVWEEEYNEDNCPAAVQGDMPQRFSICVETENIVLKKFGETKIFSSSSDGAKLIHKVYLIHPFLNDRHRNAVFVSVNHSSSNISFILDQTKCPRHIMYACFFCGGFHFIDVWGIKHLWA